MKNLTVIKQEKVFEKEFKVYGTFEEPLFLAKDVAEMIENKQVTQMVELVEEDEKLKCLINTSGQNREMWFLTEPGLYEVLLQSRKPIAKEFKKEVKKILKEIRTTGYYQAKPPMPKKPKSPTVPSIKMYQGEQVVTLRDIEAIIRVDRSTLRWYIRGEGTIFEEGKDYYFINKDKLHEFKHTNEGANALANKLILITKSGCEKFGKFYDMGEVLKLFEQLVVIPRVPVTEHVADTPRLPATCVINHDKKQYVDNPDNVHVQEQIRNIRNAMVTLEHSLKMFNRYLEVGKARNYQMFIEDNVLDLLHVGTELGRLQLQITSKKI